MIHTVICHQMLAGHVYLASVCLRCHYIHVSCVHVMVLPMCHHHHDTGADSDIVLILGGSGIDNRALSPFPLIALDMSTMKCTAVECNVCISMMYGMTYRVRPLVLDVDLDA